MGSHGGGENGVEMPAFGLVERFIPGERTVAVPFGNQYFARGRGAPEFSPISRVYAMTYRRILLSVMVLGFLTTLLFLVFLSGCSVSAAEGDTVTVQDLAQGSRTRRTPRSRGCTGTGSATTSPERGSHATSRRWLALASARHSSATSDWMTFPMGTCRC